jgi:hypothetical protein
MQRKEDRKHNRLSKKGEERMEANKKKESNDLFTYYMNLWYDYVNAWNSMYAEYVRSTTKMTESWFNSFSKFWSVQSKDKVKVE